MKASTGIIGVIIVGLLGCGAGDNSEPAGDTTTGGAQTSAGGGQTTGVASCGTVQPCGGSLVGTWKIEDTCLANGDVVVDASNICPSASLVATKVSGKGMKTWADDGTYHSMGGLSFDFKLTVPNSCFDADKSCAGLEAAMKADPSFGSASCKTSSAACRCEFSRAQSDETGTYVASGTTLTTTPADGAPSIDQYCVRGDELHDIGLDMSMPMGSMGMAKIVGDIVLTRQ
jgi:hypothetical protein